MGFTAAKEVPALDYDFAPYGPTGVTPEPSQDQVEAFREALGALADVFEVKDGQQVRDDDGQPVVDMDKVRAAAEAAGGDTEYARQTRERIHLALAEVCSKQPSVEEIAALPHRIMQSFLGYMTGTLLNPQ